MYNWSEQTLYMNWVVNTILQLESRLVNKFVALLFFIQAILTTSCCTSSDSYNSFFIDQKWSESLLKQFIEKRITEHISICFLVVAWNENVLQDLCPLQSR